MTAWPWAHGVASRISRALHTYPRKIRRLFDDAGLTSVPYRFCGNGHDLRNVGRYANGRCRKCCAEGFARYVASGATVGALRKRRRRKRCAGNTLYMVQCRHWAERDRDFCFNHSADGRTWGPRSQILGYPIRLPLTLVPVIDMESFFEIRKAMLEVGDGLSLERDPGRVARALPPAESGSASRSARLSGQGCNCGRSCECGRFKFPCWTCERRTPLIDDVGLCGACWVKTERVRERRSRVGGRHRFSVFKLASG